MSLAPRWILDELEKLWEVEPERVSVLLEHALQSNSELRWAVVVGAYMRGHINLGKAAEMLGADRWSLQEEFRKRGIPIRVGASTAEELRAEMEAAQAWLEETQR